MDIFDDLGVTRYINAHDTYTVYGASRMTEAGACGCGADP